MPATSEAPRLYPALRYKNAAKMIDWLGEAFGFSVRARYGEGDVVHHAELIIRLLDHHVGHSARGRLRQDGRHARLGRRQVGLCRRRRCRRRLCSEPRRPAPRSWKNLPTATMAAANSSAATRKAMSGPSAPTGRRQASLPASAGQAPKIASQSRWVSSSAAISSSARSTSAR